MNTYKHTYTNIHAPTLTLIILTNTYVLYTYSNIHKHTYTLTHIHNKPHTHKGDIL